MEQEETSMVYSDDEYVDAVRAHSPASTKEVADQVGVTRQGADYRLRELAEDGKVVKKMAGNSLIWMVGDVSAPAEDADTSTSPERSPSTSTAPPPEPEPTSLETLIDDVATETLPGSGSKLEERTQALHATVEYLREQGTATPADFREDVYPQHTAQYTKGSDPALSWWKNCIYKGLRELSERTDAIERPDETGEWTYTGE